MSAKIERYYSSNRNLIASIEITQEMWLALVECPFEDEFDVLVTQVDINGQANIEGDDVLHVFNRDNEPWEMFMTNCKRMFLEFACQYV